MFSLTYEFKLKPTAAQVAIFEDWLEQCRRVYNYALAERKDWFKSRSCQINACSLTHEYMIPADTKRPTYASQCKALTAYRNTSPNLQRVQSQVLQQTLRRLEQAFVSMWELSAGFPRFKKAGAMRSFVFPQVTIGAVKAGVMKLPVIGLVKFRQSRSIPDGANLKQVRIVRRASGWYAMLTLQWDVSVPDVMPHGEAIGVDVGISHLAAISNGKLFPIHDLLRSLNASLDCCNREYRERLRVQLTARKRKSKSANCTNELPTSGKTTTGY